MPFADQSQDTVYCDHTLQHFADYRRTVADWFRVVRVGGFLLIVVPHQFLFERKLAPPSRFDPTHARFYTAASLLLEVEEALDPFSYRVRFLEDNDAGFDDRSPPGRASAGCCEIVVVLQKVRRPDYAADVIADIQPKSKNADRRHVVRTADATTGPTVVMRPAAREIENIVVLKLDHRGDFILAKPAMMELRRRFPSTTLTLVCGKWNAAAAAALGIFDDILPFDFYSEQGAELSGVHRKQAIENFAALMHGRRFDLAVDLRVDPDTRQLLTRIDAGQRAGFRGADTFAFLDIALPFVNSTALKVWRSIGPERFTATVGAYSDGTIAYSGHPYPSLSAKNLVSGSGIELEAGAHTVELDLMSVRGRFGVGVEVRANPGGVPLWGLQRHVVRPNDPVRFGLYLNTHGAIDVRVTTWPFGVVRPFLFNGMRLARRGEWHGPHQMELMYMLSCTIGLRMQNPYEFSELTT